MTSADADLKIILASRSDLLPTYTSVDDVLRLVKKKYPKTTVRKFGLVELTGQRGEWYGNDFGGGECEGCGTETKCRLYGLPSGGQFIWARRWRCDTCIRTGKCRKTVPHLVEVTRCRYKRCMIDSLLIREFVADCECDVYPGNSENKDSTMAEVIQCECDGKPRHVLTNGVAQWSSADKKSEYGEEFANMMLDGSHPRSEEYYCLTFPNVDC